MDTPDLESDGFVDLLKALVRQPSVVGAEHAFFRVLQRELEERGARVTWYEGVLVAEGARPGCAMYSAHIDRHGLVCTGPGEFQYAAFVAGRRSDLLGNSVSERLMTKIVDRFGGAPVLAYEPWSGAYHGRGTIRRAYVCEHRDNLIFEVEGLADVVAGTPLGFVDRLQVQGGRLSGQLDNVLGAASLVHLFALGFAGTAFFTAQEESGSSWRFLLEWFRRFQGTTDSLVVVDTSPFPDTATADAQELVLRASDVNAAFGTRATGRVEATCRALGVSTLYKDRWVRERNRRAEREGREPQSLGSTELGRIVAASDGRVTGTTLQVPTTGYHTLAETASLASVRAFVRVLLALSDEGG